MDIRKVRENLGRIKVYYLKGETLKALGFAVMGLKALEGTTPPTDVKSSIREGIQLLAKDEGVKARLKAPLMYQPGQEKNLLVLLSKLYKEMDAAAQAENHDAALARKRALDQNINLGGKLLNQGKVSEADAAFQDALKYYKDEHRAWQMIGKCLLDAGQGKRAWPYLKKAVELEPENEVARELFSAASKAREKDA